MTPLDRAFCRATPRVAARSAIRVMFTSVEFARFSARPHPADPVLTAVPHLAHALRTTCGAVSNGRSGQRKKSCEKTREKFLTMAISCSIFTEAGHCAGKTRVSPASHHLDSLDADPTERDARQPTWPPQRRNDSMRQRVSPTCSFFGWLLILTATLRPALTLSAQTFQPPTLPVPADKVSIPQSAANAASALTDAIRGMLTKGRTLESNGRWAEALTYYEEALREYPQERSLQ